jgi:hypothetical protein
MTTRQRHNPILPFHKRIIRDIADPQEDDLLVIAKGLGMRRVVCNLLKLYDGERNLVILVRRRVSYVCTRVPDEGADYAVSFFLLAAACFLLIYQRCPSPVICHLPSVASHLPSPICHLPTPTPQVNATPNDESGLGEQLSTMGVRRPGLRVVGFEVDAKAR